MQQKRYNELADAAIAIKPNPNAQCSISIEQTKSSKFLPNAVNT